MTMVLLDVQPKELKFTFEPKKKSMSSLHLVNNSDQYVAFKAIAVGYAIMTTRSLDLDWQMRALRVLPMFLLPALSAIIYSTLMGYTRMRDRKDQKHLESLRAERQAKIDELKESTNYYTTQQLIQRYDPDPAAKAAAASVLASKLGADSGLKVYVGEESKANLSSGKSNDIKYDIVCDGVNVCTSLLSVYFYAASKGNTFFN